MGEAFSTHGNTRGVYDVLVGKTGEINHLEDPDIEGTLI